MTDMANDWIHRLPAPNWRTTGEHGSTSQPKAPRSNPTKRPQQHWHLTMHQLRSRKPHPILQVAWFLNALLNENPDTDAGLIQQIQQRPIGQLRDLHNDRVDHASLATLCTQLGILANMLSQQQAASQEIAELSHEDDGI